MTSEDADRIVKQMERQNEALESIAKSLHKMANPVVQMTMAPEGANVVPLSAPQTIKISKEA